MNADDVLARASQALCEQAGESSPAASQTRASVLRRASRRERRGKLTLLLVPIAAVLGMSTAWASGHGGVLAVWTQLETLLVPGEAASQPRARPPGAVVPQPSPPADAAAAAQVPPAMGAGIPELPVDDLPPARATPFPGPEACRRDVATCERGSSHAARPGDRSIDDEASRLYAAAHHAHFVTRNPEEALRAWDAFLEVAPDGPLAPEARYNRALTLVRLGRGDEARVALELFARGSYGPYRVEEAKALIDALSASAAGGVRR